MHLEKSGSYTWLIAGTYVFMHVSECDYFHILSGYAMYMHFRSSALCNWVLLLSLILTVCM